jgi:K+-sensing histidine kinase KdpD
VLSVFDRAVSDSPSPKRHWYQTAVFFWALALIILGAIGWFDYITGYDLHVFAFYFLPVWLIGWYVGLRSGSYMALLAAGTWFMADHTSGHPYSSLAIAGWNALMEFAACIVVATIASVVRTQLRAQEKLSAELFETMAQIKRLEGLLPICASCKQIRNERGEWEVMEKYISAHSEAQFSHSVCPACARQLYPQYFNDPK